MTARAANLLKAWAAALLAALATVSIVVALGFTSPAQAANAGDLDTSFDDDGKVMTTFGGDDNGDAVTIQGNGKIVVAGDTTGCGDIDFALARYNIDGSLDTSFGGDGKVCTGFGEWEWANAVAIQTDGEIVAAGSSYDSIPCGLDGCYQDFALARYNPNGTLDTTFSGDGKVRTGLGGDDSARDLAIQDDGKIIAAGDNRGDFVLARYKVSGSLDSSFGGDGKISTDFGDYDGAHGVAIQSDGKIVAAGWHNEDFALARYNTDGSLNTSFSGDGKLTTGFGGDALAYGVAIQADGRIVAAGSAESEDGDYDFAIVRYHSITDNTPPNTTITSSPSGAIDSTSATFTFVSSESGSKFQCSLDGTSFSGCSSPKSYTALFEGSHTFRVKAIDAVGNADPTPAVRSWTVDTIAPRVQKVVPVEGAKEIAPSTNVSAFFSEAMRKGSINSKTFKLFKAGKTTPIAAMVSYDAEKKKAILNPDANLKRGAKYKAVVTTGAKDLAGNRLDQNPNVSGNQPKRWFFTIRN